MFKKSFKVKSNNPLKGSERKKLAGWMSQGFPSLSETDLANIFPPKEPVRCLKLLSSSGETVSLYTTNEPVAFEICNKLFPTIFLLWKYPFLAYTFTTNSYVMNKLMSGADLMLAGVSKHGHLSDPRLCVEKEEVVAINTDNNHACFAVGVCLMDTNEISVRQNQGKVVKIFHVLKDELCNFVNPDLQRPSLDLCQATTLSDLVIAEPASEVIQMLDMLEVTEPLNSSVDCSGFQAEKPEQVQEMTSQFENMEDTLKYCFLAGLKLALKQGSCPILTNIFYKNFMVAACPNSDSLDIKKTSYKKLSVFLNEMSTQGIVSIETSPQNVQSIVAINPSHELFSHFKLLKSPEEQGTVEEKKPLSVREKVVVNAATLPFFSTLGFMKGDALFPSEVRKALVEYVAKENLKDPLKKELIILDPILAQILNTRDLRMPWELVTGKLIKLMSQKYEILLPSGHIISGKGVVPLIVLSVCTRSNSKKVTLIDNLDFYGVNIHELSVECQRGTAASATINTLPGKKSLQLQIQGNQIKFLLKILTEKYLIPKKYISYNEAALGKKKK